MAKSRLRQLFEDTRELIEGQNPTQWLNVAKGNLAKAQKRRDREDVAYWKDQIAMTTRKIQATHTKVTVHAGGDKPAATAAPKAKDVAAVTKTAEHVASTLHADISSMRDSAKKARSSEVPAIVKRIAADSNKGLKYVVSRLQKTAELAIGDLRKQREALPKDDPAQKEIDKLLGVFDGIHNEASELTPVPDSDSGEKVASAIEDNAKALASMQKDLDDILSGK